MLFIKEKYYKKRINRIGSSFYYDYQYRKRTYYLLLGLIPVFITDRVEKGEYENSY